MGNLPLSDLIIVGFTPDIKEWLDGGTWAQAYDIGERLVKLKKDVLEDAYRKRMDFVVDYFRDILK
jgi:hypothetical protein